MNSNRRRVALLLVAGYAVLPLSWLVAGPDLAEPGAAEWSVIDHAPAGVIAFARSGFNEQVRKSGNASFSTTVTVAAPGPGKEAGFVELRCVLPATVDLTPYRGVRFAYRFAEKLPEKTLGSAWLSLSDAFGPQGNSAQRDGIPLLADGAWHEEELPFYDFATTPADWLFDRVRNLQFSFYVRPQAPEPAAFTIAVDNVQFFERPQGAARKPAFFINLQPDAKLAAKLAAAGYVWQFNAPSDRTPQAKHLTRARLREFNAVVLTNFPQIGTEGLSDDQKQLIANLQWFVSQGGGLFMCGANDQDTGMCVKFQNELLKDYGAKVLREYVSDKPDRFTGINGHYGWTDQIAASPLTKDVKCLFYIMESGWGGTSATNPIEADSSWQVLVKAMPTAYTCALFDSKPMDDKPATYAASPPLLAVKDTGKGRLVLWPMLPTGTFIDGYHYMWDKGMILEGEKGPHKSQGLPLLLNLLHYLCEPSKGSALLGGFVPVSQGRRDLSQEPGFKPYDWAKAVVPDGPANVYKVLIGARTAMSSGSGTVADYAGAARKAGYQVLVITEDLEKMTAAKWVQLKADCRAASSADFLVVEGMKWFDGTGNQGVVFGDIGFPKEEWMVPDQPGRIKALWHFTHGSRFWPPLAIIEAGKNPKKPWFLGKSKGFAVYTYRNGTLSDESRDLYLEMMRLRFDNYPLAVHLMDSPRQVAAAAAAGLMQTWVRAPTLQDVIPYMSDTYNKDVGWYWPIFVSNGPEIKTFQALNPGTTDLAREGAERVRLRLHATSPTPLREIRITDGPNLLRRFAVNEPVFDRSMDFFHDRQRVFVGTVADQAGQEAITWGRWIEVQEQWFTNCGDNWNYMEGGKGRTSRFLTTRASERYFYPAYPETVYFGLNAVEGGKVRNLVPRRPAIFVDRVLVSRFASVIDFRLVGQYPAESSMNWNDFARPDPIAPVPEIDFNLRRYYFTSRPDAPLHELYDYHVVFKQPVTLDKSQPMVMADTRTNNKFPYDLTARCDADGRSIVEKRPAAIQGTLNRTGVLAKGGYLAMWSYPGGGAGSFVLDAGVRYQITSYAPDFTRYILLAGEGGRELPAGTVLDARFLAVTGPRFPEIDDNSFMEDIRTGFGLQGMPAYRVTPAVGKVLATDYILKLQAEGGAFQGRFTQARLPSDLPVTVAGLNPRWQAGVWYRGVCRFLRPEWDMNEYNYLICAVRERELTEAFYPGPVQDGTGYFGVDLNLADRDVFLGHPVVCDKPELFLQMLGWTPGNRNVEVHNAGDKPVSTIVRSANGFELLGKFTKQITVPPGQSLIVPVE